MAFDFLRGVRVLDLSRYLPGAYASHVLTEMGAEVVVVEEPVTGHLLRTLPPLVDGVGWAFHAYYAGAKSVTVDLKAPDARQRIAALAATAHVIIEGFRPGVAARLGIDYDSVRAAQADIVYCSLTSYGQTGPYRDRPGHDLNFVGMAGLMDAGPLPGLTVADFSGGLMAAATIAAALRSGRGAYIDLSLSDAALSLLQLHAAQVFDSSEDLRPEDTFLTGRYACYRTYATAGGGSLSVAALEVKFWQELCETLGAPEFAPLQFSAPDQPRVIAKLEAVFRGRPLEEWLARLAPLPVAPVHRLTQALAHPQFRERGMIEELPVDGSRAIRRLAFPPRVGGASSSPRRAPALGEHTREMLA
ncbi:MAG: CoA transferase [Planctomycetes bacterium]|nr:CoA transferase [Planctomycetota bacterium]